MAEKLVMLALSPTMETGTIANWRKKEGESFTSGDVLCEVETDKATMDYEATSEGILLKIVATNGARVKVGETIAISGKSGEDVSALLQDLGKTQIPQEQGAKTSLPPESSEIKEAVPKQTGSKIEPFQEPKRTEDHLPSGIKASPLARALAQQHRVDLQSVIGSGPGGRIVKEDIEKKVQEPQATANPKLSQAVPVLKDERIVHSEKRRVIAKRLSESMFTAPHFYLTIVVNMGTLLDARKKLNEKAQPKISMNAFLIKFITEAIKRHPVINSTWTDDAIIRHGSIDVGLAVAQTDGLITPVVRGCEGKGILKIDSELHELVDRARNNKLTPQEYTNATITISNLGSYGVREFTAIINPPGSAILAIGEIIKEPVVNADDSVSIQSNMRITMSCDHRVIDGAAAAEFARDLKEMIEDPVRILY